MPTYQYECEACGHSLEAFQSITEKRLKKCPKCGEAKLVRLIGTGSGIIFKGDGFYETDYKQKGEAKSDCPIKKSGHKSDGGSCACCPNNKP